MGILTGFDERLNAAMQSPMFNMGVGILANNTGHYGAFGPAFGGGIQQGMMQMNRNRQMMMRNKIFQQQLAAAKKKEEKEKKEREIAQRLMTPQPYNQSGDLFPGETPIPGLMNKSMMGKDPQGGLAQYLKETGDIKGYAALMAPPTPAKQMVVGPNSGVWNPNTNQWEYKPQPASPKAEKPSWRYRNGYRPSTGEKVLVRTNPRGDVESRQTDGSWGPLKDRDLQLYTSGQTGTPDELGMTKTTLSGVERNYMASESLVDTIDSALSYVKPENMGMIKTLRSAYQDVRGQSNAFTNMIEKTSQSAQSAGAKDFAYSSWFDPSMSALDLYANSLAYKYAKALDQGARVSDFDMIESKRALGFDRAFAHADDFVARLSALRQDTTSQMNRSARRINKFDAFPEVPYPQPGSAGASEGNNNGSLFDRFDKLFGD